MFFAKPEYQEVTLPFRYVSDPLDLECGGITIEAYGTVFAKTKYCLASYRLKNPRMYDNGDYEQMIALLQHSGQKTVTVRIQLKNGTPKDFRIDLDSLAKSCGDERFKSLELLCWVFNDESVQAITAKP